MTVRSSFHLKTKQFTTAALLAATSVFSLLPSEVSVADEADEYRIVTCRQPERVVKIGRRTTKVIPGRLIKTSARDCEIRGGRYIAEDPGSDRKVLEIWLERARTGDAEAQRTVGEIFERFYKDYKEAARWYLLAAKQGDTGAMIRLGSLYENGQGVAKDPDEAVSWYRKATGDPDIVLTSASELQAREDRYRAQEERISELKGTVTSLRGKLTSTEQTLSQRTDKLSDVERRLKAEQAKLEKVEQEVADQTNRVRVIEGAIRLAEAKTSESREARIRELETQVKAQARTLSQLEDERDDARTDLDRARRQFEAEQQKHEQSKAELAEAQLRLNESQTDESITRRQRARLAKEVERLEAEVRDGGTTLGGLRSKVTTLEQSVEQRDRMVAELSGQVQAMKAERAAFEKALESSKVEIGKLEGRVQDQEAQLSALEAERDTARRELDALQSRLASENEKHTKAEAELAEARRLLNASITDTTTTDDQGQDHLREEVTRLEAKVKRSGRDLKGMRSKLLTLVQAVKKRDERVAKLSGELREVTNERDTLQMALESSNTELGSLQNRLEQEEAKLTDAKTRYTTLNKRNSVLLGQLGRLKDELEAERTQVNTLRYRVENLSRPKIAVLQQNQPIYRGGNGTAPTVNLKGQVYHQEPIRQLTVNGKTATIRSDGSFQTAVVLGRGQETVLIRAVDAKNRQGDLEWTVDLTGQTAEPGAPVAPGPSIADLRDVDFGTYHALVIGNSQYTHWDNLPSAIPDAVAVGTLLQNKFGFKVKTLVNADKENIMRALDEYRERLIGRDHLLIYYAGHGMYDKNDKGKTYWVPANASKNNENEWINSEDISQFLEAISVSQLLVVADSCYAGTGDPTRIVSASRPVGRNAIERFKRLSRTRSRLVFTSGGDKPVLDGGADAHSVFTQSFLDALGEANDSILQIENIVAKVKEEVVQATSGNTRQPQRPTYHEIKTARHEYGSFFFIPQRK